MSMHVAPLCLSVCSGHMTQSCPAAWAGGTGQLLCPSLLNVYKLNPVKNLELCLQWILDPQYVSVLMFAA